MQNFSSPKSPRKFHCLTAAIHQTNEMLDEKTWKELSVLLNFTPINRPADLAVCADCMKQVVQGLCSIVHPERIRDDKRRHSVYFAYQLKYWAHCATRYVSMATYPVIWLLKTADVCVLCSVTSAIFGNLCLISYTAEEMGVS